MSTPTYQNLEQQIKKLEKKNKRQVELIHSLISKVPEEAMTDEDVKNVLKWLGIDTKKAWAKIKQALRTKQKDKLGVK